MPTTADLLTPPLVAFALAVALGFVLATLRAPRSAPGWLTLDALVLLPVLLPATVTANLALLATPERLVAWVLAAALAALPFAYLPVRIALARTVPTYRDTADLLDYGCAARLWRIDLPLIWPALVLGVLLGAARVAGEWFLVIGNLEQFTALTGAVLALALAATVGVALALGRPRARD